MANTPITPQNLISGVSAFTPISESDTLRWAIIQLNQLTAGGTANNAPTTQQVATAATTLEMEQSPKMLLAIALKLLIGLLGGATGSARLITGTVAPNGVVFAPSGTVYSLVSGVGFATLYTKTSAETLSTGWV